VRQTFASDLRQFDEALNTLRLLRSLSLPLRFAVEKEQAQLKSLDEANVLKLGGRRQRLRDVAAVECSSQSVVRRTLGGHERMFSWRPSA
jgi:hypothetical protein